LPQEFSSTHPGNAVRVLLHAIGFVREVRG
jgi:hypothetical protein